MNKEAIATGKKTRYALEAAALWLAFTVFRILPVDAASALGGWIGRTIGPRMAASRKALRNLKNAMPDCNDEQYAKIVRDMWDNLGRVMAEYPHLDTLANRTEWTGREHFPQQSDERFIVISGHLANWEAGAYFLARNIPAPYTSLYREPNNPYVGKILAQARNPQGKFRFAAKSAAGMRTLMKTLNEGGSIGILIDQKYNQGIEAPFFGKPAMTSAAFVQMARRYQCPLIPMVAERTHGAHFKIHTAPPILVGEQSDEEVIAQAHAFLEEQIRKKPGQWLWLHRRWIT